MYEYHTRDYRVVYTVPSEEERPILIFGDIKAVNDIRVMLVSCPIN